MATNPAVSLPNSHAVKEALEKCELVVVSDCVRHNDTTAYADILLPAQAWGEKDGTVTNSERRISRQRPFLDAPGEAKPDWWIISQIAERLGYAEQFAYRSPADIFREYATLSGYKNKGSRDLDLSGLLPLSDEEYQTLKPVQWPICDPIEKRQNVEHCTGLRGTARLFTNRRFFTQSGKAQLISITPRLPANLPDVKFPLILNTGRIRDQWHTMTRTGKSARLLRHIDESYVEIHPDDAKTVDINEGSLVQISSRLGQWIGRAKVSQNQQIGNVFVPMHFNAQNSSRAVIDALIMSSTDPISGQPEFKHTPVRISAYRPAWQGFILSKQPLTLPDEHINYWAKILSDNGWRYELAGETRPDNWADWVHQHFGENLEWLEYQDRATGRYRCANIIEGHLNICVFIAQDQKLPARQGLITLFTKDSLSPAERLGLLTVQAEEQTDSTICACFNVRRNELLKGIYEQNLRTPAQIGDKLKAGSNCGSCIPELKGLIKKVV